MIRFDRSAFFTFFAGVMLVQGVHVIEHIIQLIQVFILGVPEDDALGLLGYVYQFKGTEEFLHLGFNASYLLALISAHRSPQAAHTSPRAGLGLYDVRCGCGGSGELAHGRAHCHHHPCPSEQRMPVPWHT